MKRSNQKMVVHHVMFWFGLFSEAGRFVHTTHKTLLNMWVPLGVILHVSFPGPLDIFPCSSKR